MKQIALLLITLSLAAACRRVQPFTFVQMSDPQIGFIDPEPGYAKTDSLLKAAVQSINALQPAFVVVTGDLVNEPYNPVQDSLYRSGMAALQMPFWEIPGNHDILPYNEENHANYLRLRGYDRFSFQENGCSFIGIDSNCILDGALEAEAEQKAWLEAELARAQGSRFIFLFLHCPIFRERPDEEKDHFNFPLPKREEYCALLKKYDVSAVFAGHTHQEYATEADGIRYYTAGPVGSPLGHGYSGYHVVTVEKDSFTVRYNPTPAK